MSRRIGQIVWPLALAAVAVGAFWLFARLLGAPALPPAADGTEAAPRAGGANAEASPPRSPAATGDLPAEAGEALTLAALRQLCGAPWMAQFAPECVAALERRYGDTVPGMSDLTSAPTFKWRPVLIGEPVTWGEVFDRPEATLAAVAEAVERPECLVPEGRFRLDLRETCAADEMAKLAILGRECAVALAGYGGLESRQRIWRIDLKRPNRAENGQEYLGLLAAMDEHWFGAMWRLGKCRALPPGALDAIGPFPAPSGATHQGYGGRPQLRLMEAAARLGSDWALSSVLKMTPFEVGDVGVADVAAARPVLAELLRIRQANSPSFEALWLRYGNRSSRLGHSPEGAARWRHAFAAYLLSASLGVTVHPEGVEWMTGPPDQAILHKALPDAVRWLIEQGWTVVVVDEGGEPRRFDRPEDVAMRETWVEDWRGRRISVWGNAPGK